MNEGKKSGTMHFKPKCHNCDADALHCAEVTPETAIVYQWHSGRYVRDQMLTTEAVICLFSDRVFQVLRENRFSGWRTFPVQLFDKENKIIEGYHGLSVTGRCGSLDKPRRVPIPRGKRWWRGLYVKDDFWDGSDVFLPYGTTFVFVTQEVKDALEAIRPSNIAFIRLSEFEAFWP